LIGRRLAVLVALSVGAAGVLAPASAQALLVKKSTFGTAGTGGGQFNSPQGVAVDNSSGGSKGDVYVVDGNNFRVEKFDSAGNFILAFGKGVDQTTPGDVCTAASGDTCQAGTQGSAPGEFTQPQFVAVDNSSGASAGDVYVGDPGADIISKFDSSGNLITSWGTGGQLSGASTFGSIDGITVDNSGNLFLINDGNSVFEFAQDGTAVTNFATVRGMSRAGLDVDASGNIFKVNGDSSVEKLTSTGTDVGEVGGSTTEFVIDRSTGDLYQDNGSTINHYQFDSSGNVVQSGGPPCAVVPNGSCPPTESFGNLNGGTGLGFNPSMTLMYAAESGANDVQVLGAPSPGPPTVDSEFATSIGSTYATINAAINPFGNSLTSCQFEYVDDATFQVSGFTNATTVPCTPQDIGNGFIDQVTSASLTGLSINTTYHFEAVATNSAGSATGTDTTFTTLGAALIDSESASNVGAESFTLNTQINPLGTDTMCEFQYVDDATFQASGYTNATTVPCTPADLGNGTTDVPASANISGLTPGTTYHFHAIATNSLQPSGVIGTDTTVQTTPPLDIANEGIANVADTSATVSALIDPNGLDTKWQVQYVKDATFAQSQWTNATSVPANPVDIGSGTDFVNAVQDLTGLTPSTKYDWRFIGSNSAGSEQGDKMSFTTYPSNLPTGLPDHRAYEMVTPANKGNGEPYVRNGIFGDLQAATNGDAIASFAFSGLPGSQSPGHNYLSNRGSKNWSTQGMIPPQALETGLLCGAVPSMDAYTADMSKGILADGGSLIGTCGADLPALVPGEPRGAQNLFVRNVAANTYRLVNVTPSGVTPAAANYQASSADMSHVVFDEAAQLTGNSPNGAACGQSAGSPCDNLYDSNAGTVKLVTILPDDTPAVGTLAGGITGSVFNAVSSDGTKILFNSGGNLYQRQNGSSTVQVDASQAGGAGGGGQFLAATADGSKVFFMDGDSAGLTSNTQSGSGQNLYQYAGGQLTDLTPVSSAGIEGLAGISSNGSYLYFVALGALANGATANNNNLYLLHNGTITYIAALGGGDGCDWNGGCLTARTSSNGAFLAFTSSNSPTSFNSNGANEIYLYDSAAHKLSCASCNPSGITGSGASIHGPYTGTLLGSPGNEYLQRNVSNTGQVFFDTSDSLVPTDTNSVSDVYEWENGQLHLLSSGNSPYGSFFIDASPSGHDVFFSTVSQLVPQDGDGAADYYDARVNGGFPVSAPPPSCVGENCKPPIGKTPRLPVIGSITFSGPGNVKTMTAKVRLVHGNRVALRVRVPGRGMVTASGRGVRTVSGRVTHRGVYTLILRLDRRTVAALRHRHKLKLSVRVRYVRAGRRAASVAIVNLTVKA
jgi:hypothetical protein